MSNVLEAVERKAGRRLKNYAVFDVETRGGLTGKFEMLGFYDGHEERIFASAKEFLDAVLVDQYRSYTFFAHFAERFDFKFIIQELLNMQYADDKIEAVNGKRLYMKFIQAGGRIREIYLKDGNRNFWRFADSSWLIPTSLKKAGASFNVPVQKGTVEFDKISIKCSLSRRYCLDDCICLYQCLGAYFEQSIFKGLKPKGTIAANAMQIFRTTMKDPLKGTDRHIEDFIRKAYFGGRVEIFRQEGRDLNCYDFNSLYPSVMLDNEFPIGLPAETDRFETGYPGFYQAEVDIPSSINIPPLPCLKDGKLIFPVGRFSGYFVSCELEKVIELGGAVNVKRGVIFHHSKKIFSSYVKELYKMKAASDKDGAGYLISKLYLNGLYGKFGQRRKQSSIFKCSALEAARRSLEPYMPDIGLYIEKRESRGGYILPHIAAWVTAKARLKLFERLTPQVHYCDTDSVYTPETLPSHDTDLGALKFEKRVERAYFILPKLYRLELAEGKNITKAKGFGADFAKSILEVDFKRAIAGNVSAFSTEQQKLLGIKDSLRRFGRCPIVGTMRKSVKTTYDKRVLLPGGGTRPHCLNGYSFTV